MASLKQRYRGKWRQGNRRETAALCLLSNLLPPGYKAVLTGLGAGSSEYLESSYTDAYTAFDITVFHNSAPVAWIDVTGMETPSRKCRGWCVGSWKLVKGKSLGVLDRLWFIFIDSSRMRLGFRYAPRVEADTGNGRASICRLYRDEDPVICMPPRSWADYSAFKRWLLARRGVT